MTGYTKEFYRFFSEDLIGHIMKYISYTEQMGILEGVRHPKFRD